MKFRPNQSFDRQSYLINLTIDNKDQKQIVDEKAHHIECMQATTKPSNMKLNNNGDLNSVTGLNNLGNTCFFNSVIQVN